MEREQIIRMAREAGLHLATDVNWMPIIDLEYAEKFAELVAAAEREAIAKMFDGKVWSYDYREIAAAIRAKGNT